MGKTTKVCFVLAGAALGAGAMPPACATCIHGSQCSVSDGTTENRSDAHFKAVGPYNNPITSALVVTNGSTLNGERLTVNAGIDAATGLGGRAAHAEKGGTISLIDSIITSDGFGVNLAHDSRFTMIGGTIHSRYTALDMVGNGNHATLTGVAISSKSLNSIRHDGYSTDSTLTLDGGTIIDHTGSAAALSVGRGLVLLDDAHITVASTQLGVQGINAMGRQSELARLQANNFSVQTSGESIYGLQLSQHSDALLKNGHITTNGNQAYGIMLTGGTLSTDNISITTSANRAHAVMGFDGTGTLNNSHLTVNGSNAYGIFSDGYNDGFHPVVTMKGGSIAASGTNGRGVVAASNGQAHLDGVTITTTHDVTQGMYVYRDAAGSFNNGVMSLQGHGVKVDGSSRIDISHSAIAGASANRYGLMVQSHSRASLTNNSVIDMSGANSTGLAFVGTTDANAMTVDASKVSATGAGAFAVAANGGMDTLEIKNGSVLGGDSLVLAGDQMQGGVTYGSRLTLNAGNSQLSGHAVVMDHSTLTVNLNAGSRWTLAPSTGGRLQSDVSFLDLDGGHVVFASNQPTQTLVVGSGDTQGRTDVYRAQNGASISLNVRLNEGGALGNQYTDRLLINGDVIGTTLIHVNAVAGSEGGLTGNTARDGISIVQASGSASENAFALPGGYVTLNGQPWRYALVAYGQDSRHGAADESQRLVGGSHPHWDWRLQSEWLDPSPPSPLPPDPSSPPLPPPASPTPIRAVAPQVANYLLAPNSLFQAGLLDIASLHQRMGELRQSEYLPLDEHKRHTFFLRSYGGDYGYRSNLGPSQYGVNADMRYAATQIGSTTRWVDKINSRVQAGLSVNYGALAFTPRQGITQTRDTQKTRMDTWSISPALVWQHHSGAYVDTVLAYRQFKGNVSTHLRGKTASLKGHGTAFSTAVGVPFSIADLTIEPHMQII